MGCQNILPYNKKIGLKWHDSFDLYYRIVVLMLFPKDLGLLNPWENVFGVRSLEQAFETFV
jgi:hypothetical protein